MPRNRKAIQQSAVGTKRFDKAMLTVGFERLWEDDPISDYYTAMFDQAHPDEAIAIYTEEKEGMEYVCIELASGEVKSTNIPCIFRQEIFAKFHDINLDFARSLLNF